MTHAMGQAVSAEPAPSKGLGYGIGMLVFMVAEITIFANVNPDRWTDSHLTFLIGMGVAAAIQAAGMWLTYVGRYKLGGNLQIVASAMHVLDLMGVIGIIGGVLSRRYPEKLAASGEE